MSVPTLGFSMWMLILPFPQHLYSIHLADQAEDCTLQLADHIKVSGDSPSLIPLFHLCALPGSLWELRCPCCHCPVQLLFPSGGSGVREWGHVSGRGGLYPRIPKGRTSILHPME